MVPSARLLVGISPVKQLAHFRGIGRCGKLGPKKMKKENRVGNSFGKKDTPA